MTLQELLFDNNVYIRQQTEMNSISPTVMANRLDDTARYAAGAYLIPLFTDNSGNLSDTILEGVDVVAIFYSGSVLTAGTNFSKNLPDPDIVMEPGNSLPANTLMLLASAEGSTLGNTITPPNLENVTSGAGNNATPNAVFVTDNQNDEAITGVKMYYDTDNELAIVCFSDSVNGEGAKLSFGAQGWQLNNATGTAFLFTQGNTLATSSKFAVGASDADVYAPQTGQVKTFVRRGPLTPTGATGILTDEDEYNLPNTGGRFTHFGDQLCIFNLPTIANSLGETYEIMNRTISAGATNTTISASEPNTIYLDGTLVSDFDIIKGKSRKIYNDGTYFYVI